MHSEGHLLEGAHELGGADHHRLLLAANNVVMQSHAEGPASQISDQTSNEDEHLHQHYPDLSRTCRQC